MSKKKAGFEISLVITVIFMIFFLLSQNSLFIKIGLAYALLVLLVPAFRELINRVFEYIVKVLGFLNAHILLGLIFFVILFPIALIYRLIKGDTLGIRKFAESSFVERNMPFTSKHFENPW